MYNIALNNKNVAINIKTPEIMVLKRLVKVRPGGKPYRLWIHDLVVHENEKIALVGPSGCGKSTLLDMMAMVLMPDGIAANGEFSWINGNEKFDIFNSWKVGDSAGRANREKIRCLHMGYVLQAGGLFPFLNLKDNISLTSWLKKYPNTNELLEKSLIQNATILGIGHLLRKLPSKISVGERQRVAVARSIIHKPKLILADEPTASLDPHTAVEVFKIMRDLSRNTAFVIATHNEDMAKEYGFTIYKINVEPTNSSRGIKATLTKA
jgi:putative ABC transport system ATP-binding protein